jgi:hypothetical protein
MSQQTKEVDVASDLNPSDANALEYEHSHFRALHRWLEAAAEALIRVRDQLRARAFQGGHCHDGREYDAAHAGKPDPDGGRP